MANLINLFSGTFTPKSVANLLAWYDFSDGGANGSLFSDTTRTTAITADATVIAGVTDKSGAGNHLSQATGGNRPSYKVNIKNGRSISRWNGGQKLASGAFGAATAQPYTLFTVSQVTTLGIAYENICAGNTAGHGEIAYQKTAAHPVSYAGTLLVGASALATATWYIHVAIFNGVSSTLYTNGGSADASGNAGSGTLDGVTLGDSPVGGQPLNGDIAEYLAYSGSVSVGNINALGSYLGTKWGITWSTAS